MRQPDDCGAEPQSPSRRIRRRLMRTLMPLFRMLLTGIGVLALAACAAGPRSALMLHQLRNADYQCEWAYPQSVKLEDGFFWKRLVPRSPVELRVAFARYAVGELDGDAAYDAAVVLVVSPDDGTYYRYLAAVINRDGHPHNVATVLLGDRLEVRDLAIRNRRIRVAVVLYEPGAPVVSPDRDQEQWWTFRLQDDQLIREP